MDIRSQVSMVFHLDKCIGCHTCSLACKNIWTDRKGTEYMYWNNVETKPGTGYPTRWEDQNKYRGGWVVDGTKQKNLRLRLQGKWGTLSNIFYNPYLPTLDDYFEPWTYDYQNLINAPLSNDQPTARPISMVTGKYMDTIEAGPNWDDDLGGSQVYANNDPNFDGASDEEMRQINEINSYRLLLPAAYLQSLPESGLRCGVPAGRDLQARRGWRGAGEPGAMPCVAHVRLGLPLQEDIFQLVDRQGREVHPVLSAP